MNSLLPIFVNNLLPIFLAAGAGFVLSKTIALEARTISRVVFYVFSPCLVFNLLTQNALGNGALLQIAAYTTVQMGGIGVLTWGIARLLKLNRQLTVAVILAAILPNAGNFGLSVNLFAFGETALAYASISFVTSGIIANTAGVYIASLGKSSYKQALLGLVKIPTIYAVIIGLVFISFGWQLPVPVERTVGVLADAAIPSMLILLGMLLGKANFNGKALGLVLANSMRLLAAPALAIALSPLFGLTGAARQAGILEVSMPTAVMTTVLASEFQVEPEFATAAVFTSTLLSPLTLTPLLAFLGG